MRVNGRSRLPALNVKVMDSETSADPAVLWLRAPQLCYLGGHALQSGEIIGILQKLKDVMPAELADSQKGVEDDSKTDHAPLVAVTENEEVATLTATIETNFQQGDLQTGLGSLSRDQASSEWKERQTNRADEFVTVHDTVNLETEVDG